VGLKVLLFIHVLDSDELKDNAGGGHGIRQTDLLLVTLLEDDRQPYARW
jgi:hypothetical protein